jgi:sialic acid synthase SpsE
MNVAAIPRLAAEFGVTVGLSDHTLSPAVAVAAVALGASIVEKHVTMARAAGGPDAGFSLEPDELRELVAMIRTVERARGSGEIAVTSGERANRIFRRSLYVAADVRAGEVFTEKNVRSVRPAHGLPPRYYRAVLGRTAARDIARGTALTWDLVRGGAPRE